MNTRNTTPLTAAQHSRVPLGRMDVRSGEAARKLARVLPVTDGSRRPATFNSAL
ncbi:FxSxx-COOH cyclophane-containing RiPP peptide [Streptomyces clavuligerus]|uniref:FxSxx-COOH cyclophane-containing RiPP peptide n=1 Tax=Streptomyces clavuligerus TaxID=1901 RepID=UPI00020D94AB|nr:FxSxx-COOH cyclophane-containing RiPP peptide [Streptomyces clavuligerus]ANW20914.1 FXSXX-COOH protein [Streptomyces clavuligerus]AXU15537.1 FXSXX-COOH protein [Streptomyces clavuligerus]MBY6305642.1 FXSXX-COOH protein [Streptomyces clavuligerus]QPJ92352.1 FXSXX-COOH protein [Streptomyces clavuligerus]QPL65533.1 FXSXX-COOH protein [Streptomyces clavuligerus]